MLAVNLEGVLLASQAFARQMEARGGGALVHVSSIAASQPQPFSGAYSPGKAAVSMLSRQLAYEMAPLAIRSNVVSPGLVLTPLSQAFYADAAVREARERHVPAGRQPASCGGATPRLRAKLVFEGPGSDRPATACSLTSAVKRRGLSACRGSFSPRAIELPVREAGEKSSRKVPLQPIASGQQGFRAIPHPLAAVIGDASRRGCRPGGRRLIILMRKTSRGAEVGRAAGASRRCRVRACRP